MKRLLIILVACGLVMAAETFDSWIEEPLLFGIAAANQPVIAAETAVKYFDRDTVNVRQGDFSMVFTADKAGKFKLGLTRGKFIDGWNLAENTTLLMSVMADRDYVNLPIEIVDAAGNIAKSVVDISEGKWNDLNIPLVGFDGFEEIDTSAIKAVQFVIEVKKGDKIWFDGVRFSAPGMVDIGVTDKTIEQRIEEAKATKDLRRNAAFAEVARTGGFKILLNGRFAKLWLNQDVDKVNAELLEIFTTDDKTVRDQYGIDEHWALFLTSMLNRLYFNFGSKSKVFPGRLYPETEKALLELMWERTKDKNDIYLSKLNTWWMEGSENHDINAKVADLLSSQIFMNEPDFKDRIYPDHGNGGGEGYWFHQMYADSENFGPHGRASFKDHKKKYNAAAHYKAWVRYLDEYLTERAKKGFFVEVGSPGYMKYTVSFINDIYDYCDDKQLRKRTRDFLDLFWTDWALKQINGVHGGGRTRDHVGIGGKDALYDYCQFLLGGQGSAAHAQFAVLLTDYTLPKAAFEFAFGRRQLGSYEYITRKPGEANNEWPAPLGTERIIRCDTESRLLHYCWVTPDYIIGTQMDHPGAVHCHLSAANRTQGIIFSTSPEARIFPRDLEQSEDGKWKISKNSFYRSVQHKDVLITQQAKGWFARHPDWFPSPPKPVNLPFGVYMSKSIEKKGEKDGWIFLQEGNSFIAVNVIHCPGTGGRPVDQWSQVFTSGDDMAEPRDIIGYEWVSDELIKCKDAYDTIIIETSSVDKHGTMQAFMDDILDNSLRVEKTVVPGYYVVYYTGCKDAPQIYFNAASLEIPMLGGQRLDYAPKNVISSKYMNAVYGSGKIYVDRFGEKSRWKF